MLAIPASHLQCDTGLTWDPSAKLCVGSPEHQFNFYYEKCPRSTESSSLPRFYPVSNHNTLLSIIAGLNQNPDDVVYCMDPKFVKTWVKLAGGFTLKVGHSKTCPTISEYGSLNTLTYNMKPTAEADPGCGYHDGTFAELGECGIYSGFDQHLNDVYIIYMCVNYVSPAKLPKTWPMVASVMTAAVTVPYQLKFNSIEYHYPVGDFAYWKKTPLECQKPQAYNFWGASMQGCSAGYKEICGDQGCTCECNPNYNATEAYNLRNLPVSSYTPPYVNGNYFVPSAPAYCTSNGKQPWIDWKPKDDNDIYPAQPCLRAHDNQQDCEAPIHSHCQINRFHPNGWTGSHSSGDIKYHFNKCKDYVTQTGCEGAYMGHNDWGNSTGWKPWQMPGTGVNVVGGCDNANVFDCGIHCTEYQTHCRTATSQSECASTMNSGSPCVWLAPQHPISPCEWVPTPAGVCTGPDLCTCTGPYYGKGPAYCTIATTDNECWSKAGGGGWDESHTCNWQWLTPNPSTRYPCKWGINGDGENTISRPCEADGCYQPCYQHGTEWKCGASQRQE